MLKKNNLTLLEYLFINNIFSEEEARQALIEEGADIEKIDSKVNEFLKKLEAKKLIIMGQLKKAEFEKNLEEFKELDVNNTATEDINYSLAARKGENSSKENGDERLLDFIKKKEKDKD